MSYAVARMQKMKSHDLKGIQFHNQILLMQQFIMTNKLLTCI
ncbi:hypothetical protein ACUXQR_002450 [Staphylococcus epidermidis]